MTSLASPTDKRGSEPLREAEPPPRRAPHRRGRRVLIRLFRLAKDDTGAVATEFVILAPLYLFLIIGSIQLMGIAHADALLQVAAFMAARTGAVHHEAVEKGWYGESGDSLAQRMAESAARVLLPYHDALPNYEYLGTSRRAITTAPVIVMRQNYLANWGAPAIGVQWQTIDVEEYTPYLPTWLAVQVHVALGMPFPWAGNAIAAVARGARGPQEGEFASLGMDAFATAGFTQSATVWQFEGLVSADMPWIELVSNATLDVRASIEDDHWVPWPLCLIEDQSGLGWERYKREPQPVVVPLQNRFRSHF